MATEYERVADIVSQIVGVETRYIKPGTDIGPGCGLSRQDGTGLRIGGGVLSQDSGQRSSDPAHGERDAGTRRTDEEDLTRRFQWHGESPVAVRLGGIRRAQDWRSIRCKTMGQATEHD